MNLIDVIHFTIYDYKFGIQSPEMAL